MHRICYMRTSPICLFPTKLVHFEGPIGVTSQTFTICFKKTTTTLMATLGLFQLSITYDFVRLFLNSVLSTYVGILYEHVNI